MLTLKCVVFKYMTQHRISILVDREQSILVTGRISHVHETLLSFTIVWNGKIQISDLGPRVGLNTLFPEEKLSRTFSQGIFPHNLSTARSALCQALGTCDVTGAVTVLSFMMLSLGWFFLQVFMEHLLGAISLSSMDVMRRT